MFRGNRLIRLTRYLCRGATVIAEVCSKGPIISGTKSPLVLYKRNMKLVTDEGNYSLLKIYAAANIAKQEIEVDLVERDSKEFQNQESVHQGQLPYLELNGGKLLFGANTICQHFIEEGEKGHSQDVDKQKVKAVLDWDTTTVQACAIPYVAAACNGNEVQPIILQSLEKCLYELNELVKAGENVVGVAITLADIALWGTLFVTFLEGHAVEGVEEKYPAASKWFHSLSAKDEFRAAQNKVIRGNDVTVFKKSINYAALANNCVTGPSGGGNITEEGPSANEVLKAKEAWLKGRGVIPTKKERQHPILPLPNERNILITSALPYVNNVPHLGNIIGCVLSGDVYARYCRLRGHNCLYICGTDEYGTATETKALEEGLTPQQICDKYNKVHEDVYRWFNIEFDFFGRTTTKQQTEIAQDIFWKLEENGYLSKGSVAQLFCEKCQRFLADRFVEGICPQCSKDGARGDQCDSCGKLINAVDLKSPKCKVCEAQPVVKSSDHIFLDLPKIEPELREWVGKAHEEGQWTHNAIGITKGWLQEGLLPRCITRDLKWGTPVPTEGYTDKVFYVWFDAPIGYLSITANYTDQWEKWWKNPDEVTLVQFMAKDNVPFHTVVFPCSLIGAKDNYTLLNDISATEYLNYEDDKFSKSRGIGVFGDNAADTGIAADVYRFYLLAVRPESQDSVFSWDDFVTRNNTELLNNLGNFINRALSFLSNNFQGLVPPMQLTVSDFECISLINREIVAYIENLEKIKLREGLRNILNISRLGNQYLQSTKPWTLVKGTEAERDRAGSVIALSCNICALLGQLLSPYMPEASQEIRNQLQYPAEFDVIPDLLVPVLPEKHQIGLPNPLFKKIEPSTAKELKERFGGGQAK